MRIETQNLLLRDHKPEDWKDIHQYAKVPEFSQYDFWGPNTEQDSIDFVNTMIDQANHDLRYKFDLAIVHKESNKVIGGVGIRRITENSLVADLGYAINPDFQGKGFASEAVKAMFDFAFEKLNLKVIYATCDVKNIPSYKVMEKCGMTKVGEIKNHKEFKGAWHDSFRYEIYN